jgi:hypothetical protein
MFWTLFFQSSAVIGLILVVSWLILTLFIKQADDGES